VVSEFAQQLLFDALISMGERLHPSAGSNNVHALSWSAASEGSPAGHGDVGNLRLVYIDQGHYCYEDGHEENLRVLNGTCTFPLALTNKLGAGLARGGGSVGVLMRALMGPEIEAHLVDLERNGSSTALASYLGRIDANAALVGEVLSSCVQRHGAIFVV
jgi:hypothetical protein